MNRTIRFLGGILFALILLTGVLLHALQEWIDSEGLESGRLTVEISAGEVSWSLSWSGLEDPVGSD